MYLDTDAYLSNAQEEAEKLMAHYQQTQSYPQRVRESMLPLSVADNLPEAFSEWSFTGVTEDHEIPCEVCEMCGQQDLRYHFQIQNLYTHHQLNVGSHCILRFDVPVYADGERLSATETKKYLEKLTKQMQLESCIRALERLAKQENNQILAGALEYYKRNKKLTPKQAFVVFWRLRHNSIDHHPSFFSINLKKQRFVEDLRNMETAKVHFFWSALSSSQKRKAMEMGHSAPS